MTTAVKTPAEMAAELSRNPEALRQFLHALPSTMRGFILDEVANAQREEQAHKAAEAFGQMDLDVYTYRAFLALLNARQLEALREAFR